jgi:hypothetical protein
VRAAAGCCEKKERKKESNCAPALVSPKAMGPRAAAGREALYAGDVRHVFMADAQCKVACEEHWLRTGLGHLRGLMVAIATFMADIICPHCVCCTLHRVCHVWQLLWTCTLVDERGCPYSSVSTNLEPVTHTVRRPPPHPQLRACAFKVVPSHSAAQLQQLLPFVGRFTATIIHQLAASGTCAPLEAYARDLPASDSRGNVRLETTGGHEQMWCAAVELAAACTWCHSIA